MRVGIYVTNIGVAEGYEENVSGHAQIPLQAASLLDQAGHEVEIVTTARGPDRVLPSVTPKLPIHELTDPRARVEQERPRTRVGTAALHAFQLCRLARRRHFDVIHAFGAPQTARALSHLRRSHLLRTPVVFSLLHPLPTTTRPRAAYGALTAITASSRFVGRSVRSQGLDCEIVKHGPVRSLRSRGQVHRNRVLFWREASINNGGDLSLATFAKLAPEFRDITFTLALRPSAGEIKGVDEVASQHPNIEVHRFPYSDDTDLHTLLAESLCVCLPFRKQTIYPQLAILESLDAGVPVISTPSGDIPEVIDDGVTGFLLVDTSTTALTNTLHELLDQPTLITECANSFHENDRGWNWDRFVEQASSLYR